MSRQSAPSRRSSEYGRQVFQFGRLTLKERSALIRDIISPYEACLLDLGKARQYTEIVYPEDR